MILLMLAWDLSKKPIIGQLSVFCPSMDIHYLSLYWLNQIEDKNMPHIHVYCSMAATDKYQV